MPFLSGSKTSAKNVDFFRNSALPDHFTQYPSFTTLLTMLKHYLSIAFRNLMKHGRFTIINILGLTISLTCCLLIFIFISHELSFDDFHVQADDIYRITYEMSEEEQQRNIAITPNIIAPTLIREFPQVQSACRVYPSKSVLKFDDQMYEESGIIYADSSFLDIFDFAVLEGDSKSALDRPHTIVLTRRMAQKYFQEQSPIGKTLLSGSNLTPYEVTAVVENPPLNSHLDFDFIFSYLSLGKWAQEETFGSANYFTYTLLRPGSDPAIIENGWKDILKRDAEAEYASAVKFHLQPLKEVHLQSSHLSYTEAGSGDITYIYLISAIGMLILFIACINFMNLATARSIDRAKEVGLRKVVGASRLQLIVQFLGEATFITFCSLILAIVLSDLLLPWFNQLTGRPVTLSTVYRPAMLAGFGHTGNHRQSTGRKLSSHFSFAFSAYPCIER